MVTVLTPEVGNKVLDKLTYFEQTGYTPHEAQKQIHLSRARHRVLSNGRRWGKTLCGGKEAEVTAFVKNRLGEPQRGWIIGPNYTDCEKEFRVLHDSLKSLGVDQVSSKFLSNVDNGNMHITTKWGWDVQCRSAAHPETLVGEGLDWVILAEAGRLTRRTFTQYIRPALSDKRGWSLMTGVPEIATEVSLLYWGYSRGQDETRKGWASWKMPSWTNLVVFPGGRYDEEILEAEDDLTEDEFARQYGGEFVERVGRVMQEWDDDKHLKALKYNPNLPLYAACDYGYTNPFVWLWIQVDELGNVYVLEERRWRMRDTNDVVEDLLNDYPVFCSKLVAFYPDPAEPDDTLTLVKKLRKPARINGGGEIKTRLQMIRQKLKCMPDRDDVPYEERQPSIYFDRNKCSDIAWEMREGYRWPEHKSDVKNDTENPMDKDNHGPEALGRFIKGYFEVTGPPRKARQKRAKVRR